MSLVMRNGKRAVVIYTSGFETNLDDWYVKRYRKSPAGYVALQNESIFLDSYAGRFNGSSSMRVRNGSVEGYTAHALKQLTLTVGQYEIKAYLASYTSSRAAGLKVGLSENDFSLVNLSTTSTSLELKTATFTLLSNTDCYITAFIGSSDDYASCWVDDIEIKKT